MSIHQVPADLQWVLKLLDLVEAQYVGNMARHIEHPETSMISILPQTEFKKMTTAAIQELISCWHVIVTSIPARQDNFDMAGLQALCSPDRVFHIHG